MKSKHTIPLATWIAKLCNSTGSIWYASFSGELSSKFERNDECIDGGNDGLIGASRP